jgi:hypothetical protein
MDDDRSKGDEPVSKHDVRAARDRRIGLPIAGAWLIASPFVFRYARSPAGTSELISGSVLLALAALSSANPSGMAFEPSLVVGLWLCLAPFLLAGANVISSATDLLAGFVVVALSTRPMDPDLWRRRRSEDLHQARRRGGRKRRPLSSARAGGADE